MPIHILMNRRDFRGDSPRLHTAQLTAEFADFAAVRERQGARHFMTRVGLVLMIGFCAAGAVAASAAETSISRTVTGAFNTVVIQATNAATAATKAADDAIQSAKKKKSKDAKASKSKDADAKDAEEPASSNANGKPGSDDKAPRRATRNRTASRVGTAKTSPQTESQAIRRPAKALPPMQRRQRTAKLLMEKLAILKPPRRSRSSLPSGRRPTSRSPRRAARRCSRPSTPSPCPRRRSAAATAARLRRSGSSASARTRKSRCRRRRSSPAIWS